ncbi:MAG: outer membrane beta-barrel protein [Planctomycetales bacterium]|nr:outer membrane beta-barrel protein [Planctomycetales bacterium]NIM09374.1 outer membrane beta-barrel protein [Planctomycetales bacterium]NIN08841.1 outer membrane beta-barrel protein [Planctomycetales bacterium]NIN77958.1 outer membrane beta-barrel protein [Planctomycetales bacterium]NIO35141.1 outer membrane beta-barrel protein [Planctomycetales bacterium]
MISLQGFSRVLVAVVATLVFSSYGWASCGCAAGCDQNGNCTTCGCAADTCDANGEGCGCEANGKDCGCEANGNGCGCASSGDCDCCGWCNLGDAWKLQRCDNCLGITYGGWVSLGYHSDQTPLSDVFNDLLAFNDRAGVLNLHQAWVYMEREADGQCEWDMGFRVDFMYGTDAQKTQAFGQPTGWDTDWDHGGYGFALPQAYLTFDKDDLTITVGKFFTMNGYEVVPATGNFFYSHALTMFNSEPFTHTGLMVSYDYTDDVTFHAGWTAGWDTGFRSFEGGSNFHGGVTVPLLDDLTMTYVLCAGDMGLRGEGYNHSLVFDWVINNCWEYVLQSDLVALEADALNGGANNDQFGINQYLFYTINDCLKAGVRAEWWQTDNLDRYEVTFGVNVRPHANLVVRPEVRYDWGSGASEVLLPNTPNGEATTFGIDAVLTF